MSLAADPHSVQHWIDIAPPLPPAARVDPLAVGAVILLLLMAGGLLAWHRSRPGARARRALRRLAREVRTSRIDRKPAGLLLREKLCQGLGVARLDRHIRWRDTGGQDWQAYLDRLGRCCFSASPPPAEELANLIDEALRWLDKQPVAD